MADGNRQLGRYELIAEIASGGMGTVLLARLAGAGGFQRMFAVKLLHKQYAGDHEFIEMLLDEARIAAMIHHPNVVSIQEVCETPGAGYYLVMDYVEGFPLWDLSHAMKSIEPRAKWRIVLRVALDALNGLEAAHTLTDDLGAPLHVVHRDISPQNILVSVNGIGRVTDFGIAKAAARITTTRVGQVKGKLAYMSPEQARGRAIDLRSDLWAMGVVMWEAISARRLFKVDNETETYNRVLSGPLTPLHDVVAGMPPAVSAMLARALERDVNRRYGSAREMAEALEHVARSLGLLADAHEVGAYIRSTFAGELALRRSAIRQAAAQPGVAPGQRAAQLPGGIAVPALPEHSVSLRVASPAPPPAVAPTAEDFDESMDTIVVGADGPVASVRSTAVSSASSDDDDDVATHRVGPSDVSPAVQRALEHARAVMSQPSGEARRVSSGQMVAVRPTAPPSQAPAPPSEHPDEAYSTTVQNNAPTPMQAGAGYASPRQPTMQLVPAGSGTPSAPAPMGVSPAMSPMSSAPPSGDVSMHPQPPVRNSGKWLGIGLALVGLAGWGIAYQLGYLSLPPRRHATTPMVVAATPLTHPATSAAPPPIAPVIAPVIAPANAVLPPAIAVVPANPVIADAGVLQDAAVAPSADAAPAVAAPPVHHSHHRSRDPHGMETVPPA